jgi:hypothetical protein
MNAASQDIHGQIEDLKTMSVAQLRERYREVFGEASSSGNRQWLTRRIAWRIQSLAEGGLSDRARRRAEELARDADVRLRAPVMADHPGSTIAVARLPLRGARVLTVSGRIVKRSDDRAPLPGAVLCRHYKGVDHRVAVLRDGFEHDGKVYRSLSAVATAITGSHWNGYLFFGLTGKESA